MGTVVVYFSRAGENYGVGTVEEGNTEVVARMIADQTGGDLRRIEPVTPYPAGYEDCTVQARLEKASGARPPLRNGGPVLTAIDDPIFLGYPIWWEDMPMPVYTFIEAHDWAGKRVLPFCTSGGSGLSGTDTTLGRLCRGATVDPGLVLDGTTAQLRVGTALAEVRRWLRHRGLYQ
ncbi:MAG: flavodoxin [Bifidobacteriaceae bacterium]|jgi:flavodoxin|nr:flavodoxin [Bifidobacteriaceae bacterium]